MYICMYVCIYIYTYIYICLSIYLSIYIYIHTYVSIYIYIYIYTYIYIYIYTHLYMDIYMHIYIPDAQNRLQEHGGGADGMAAEVFERGAFEHVVWRVPCGPLHPHPYTLTLILSTTGYETRTRGHTSFMTCDTARRKMPPTRTPCPRRHSSMCRGACRPASRPPSSR